MLRLANPELSACLPMRKRSQGKAKRPERRLVQSELLLLPYDSNSTYDVYASFRSGSLNAPQSAKDVLKHSVQLVLWFALLTTFLATQRALSHAQGVHATAPLTMSCGPTRAAERADHPRL